MSAINLSASIRANLLSLKNTTELLLSNSNRLSTSKKVNSALDSPNLFFTAKKLTNRAEDLKARKDGIGQAISLLESTDQSLKSLTSLVEQAKAKAQQAEDAATAGNSVISTEKATTISGVTTVSTAFGAGATSDAVTLVSLGATAGTLAASIEPLFFDNIIIGAGTTIADLVTYLDGKNGVDAVYNTTTNQIDITANGGTDLKFSDVGASVFTGMGGFKADDGTVIANLTPKTFASQNKDTDQLADAFGLAHNDTIITTVTSGGTNTFTVADGTGDTATTIADLVAAINKADTALTASYNTNTSKIDIKAADGVAVDFSGTGFTGLTLNTGTGNLTSGVDVTYSKLGTEAEVGSLTTDFRSLLRQIDKLIGDASFKGKNLLKGSASLNVKFNVSGDSNLTVSGRALEADSNGILSGLKFTQKADDYDFTTAGDISSALADVDKAITELRSVSSTFGTSLGIIQTREDFTSELVGTLEEGAGKLVNTNLEEEVANQLALQTRQTLALQSLTITNLSQQSILSMFV
ncbi:MAG: hypothetical protein H8E39_08640 [Alphaproteobacteria bacterium]|nr:hypothetical protein [Alphaproteobacteria bacterium]